MVYSRFPELSRMVFSRTRRFPEDDFRMIIFWTKRLTRKDDFLNGNFDGSTK